MMIHQGHQAVQDLLIIQEIPHQAAGDTNPLQTVLPIEALAEAAIAVRQGQAEETMILLQEALEAQIVDILHQGALAAVEVHILHQEALALHLQVAVPAQEVADEAGDNIQFLSLNL